MCFCYFLLLVSSCGSCCTCVLCQPKFNRPFKAFDIGQVLNHVFPSKSVCLKPFDKWSLCCLAQPPEPNRPLALQLRPSGRVATPRGCFSKKLSVLILGPTSPSRYPCLASEVTKFRPVSHCGFLLLRKESSTQNIPKGNLPFNQKVTNSPPNVPQGEPQPGLSEKGSSDLFVAAFQRDLGCSRAAATSLSDSGQLKNH